MTEVPYWVVSWPWLRAGKRAWKDNAGLKAQLHGARKMAGLTDARDLEYKYPSHRGATRELPGLVCSYFLSHVSVYSPSVSNRVDIV